MKFKKIQIEGFGKFKDFEFNLEENLNIIFGKNESGKTTLSNFLIYTTSGFSKEEVEKYRPWDNGTFGGQTYINTDDGEEKVLSLDPDSPSQERFLRRMEYETTSYIPEEGGIDISQGLDGVLLARLRKRMEEIEHMERVVQILSNEQKIYNEIVEKERELLLKVHELEEEVRKLKNKVDEEKNLRKRYVDTKLKLKKLSEKLENLKNKLLAARILKARAIWEETDKVRVEISSLGMKISNLKKYMSKNDEDIEHVKELKFRLDSLNRELKRLQKELEEKNKLAETLKERIKVLEGELSIETEEDAERIGLKVKNLELSLKMYQDKLKPKGFNEKWKIFHERKDVLERIERIRDAATNVKKLEDEIKKVEEELRNIEGELKYSQLSISTKRFLGIVFLVLAGGLIAVGLFTKILFLLSIIASVSIGTSLAFFISTGEHRKNKQNLENEKAKLELNKKVLEKKAEGLKSDIQKLVESMGFENYEELMNEYKLYERWVKESKEAIESEEVKAIEQELLKGLSEFYENIEEPYEHLVEKLKSKVEEYTSLREKLGVVNMNIESLNGRILATEKDISNIQDEFENYMRKLECERFEDCEEIKLKKREYEELVNKRKKLEENLEDLKEKWEKYRSYHDLEIPEGVNVENLEPEEILISSVESTEIEINNLNSRVEDMEKELSEKTVDPDELYNKLGELEKLKLLHEVYSEAVRIFPEVIKVFQEIKNEFVEKYKYIFEEKFQDYVRKIINDSTFRLIVRDDLAIEISLSSGRMGDLTHLSRATRDQIELAYKLALYETLSPKESYPLVIDNALVRYDDERLKKVTALLKELSKNRQIIITTSDNRVVAAFGKKRVKNLE